MTIERAERVLGGGAPRTGGEVYVGGSARELAVFGGILPSRIDCEGPTPTVDNTDTIRIGKGSRVGESSVIIGQGEGSFEPGATSEADGSSEVEVEIAPGAADVLELLLSPSADSVSLGSIGAGIGANLDAREASPDVDLQLASAPVAVVVGAGAGRDLVDAVGDDVPFDGPLSGSQRSSAGIAVLGGGGADHLIGTPSADSIFAGGGRDRIEAGGGADTVDAVDGAKDTILCGSGRERSIHVDPVDTTSRCYMHRSR